MCDKIDDIFVFVDLVKLLALLTASTAVPSVFEKLLPHIELIALLPLFPKIWDIF